MTATPMHVTSCGADPQVARARRRVAAGGDASRAELDSFLSAISHDLRAPMRAIDGFSTALREEYADQLDDTAREYIDELASANVRMRTMLDALLELSRLGRGPLREEHIDVTARSCAIAEQLRAAQPQRAVIVQLEEGLEARGDPPLVDEVLRELIDNAWRFTAREAEANVHVGCLRDTPVSGQTVFFVRDNGIGFEPHSGDQLFLPFRALHGTDDGSGVGMGLARVRRIVGRHGGRVWAKGGRGHGASLFFTLPAAR